MGISTDITALTSAITPLHSHTLLLCVLALGLLALAILTLVNLRGVSERGGFFPFPTYLFLACIAVVLALGIAKTVASGGHPAALIRPPSGKAAAAFSFWLVIKAYGSGCTALTGMEAVSNGVSAFRGDRVKNAQRTLGLIVFALAIMLAGIAVLVKHFNCCNGPEWEKLSKCSFYLVRGCYGRGWFYYVAISVFVLLTFSANTAFADFPRVSHFVAEDGFLPTAFANRRRRLVYTEGIIVLTY